MRRFAGLMMSGVAAAVLLAVDAGSAAAGPAPARSAAACTVRISSLTFDPAAVSPGRSSTAQLVARNCTRRQVSALATWSARFVGPDGGFPAGCPVIDPLALPVTLAPHARAASSVGYLVPASCTAASLHLTVRISSGATVLAERSADLIIAPVPGTAP
jgi:hypothetical protein